MGHVCAGNNLAGIFQKNIWREKNQKTFRREQFQKLFGGNNFKNTFSGNILAGTFWQDFFFTIRELYVQNAPFLNKGSET